MNLNGLIAGVGMFLLNIQCANAIEMKVTEAVGIEVVKGAAMVYSRESFLFGLSCQSESVGAVPQLKQLKLGDTITLKDVSFKIGIIQVNEVLEDASFAGKVVANKGDVVCLAASNKSNLPSGDGCAASWVHVAECRVLH